MDKPYLDVENPFPWLRNTYSGLISTIKYVPEEYRDCPERFVRISFTELHRIHLRNLQCRLARHAVDICFEGLPQPEPEDADVSGKLPFEKDLKDYSKSSL